MSQQRDAALARWSKTSPADRRAAAQHARSALPKEAQATIRELVAGWPEFTAEQRANLARLLGKGVESGALPYVHPGAEYREATGRGGNDDGPVAA